MSATAPESPTTTPKACKSNRSTSAPSNGNGKPPINAPGEPARAAKDPVALTAAKPGADRKAVVRRAADLLKQVSDPTRLSVLLMLAEGPRNVGDICKELGQSQPATSH